ncbi:anti-sigma factor family protein [Streptomyces lavendulae]|uniref:anti-sigma factor family protein n=1 Tax=Streptomyces lavendulae TaxID=1914 RepID=UPI0036CA25C5
MTPTTGTAGTIRHPEVSEISDLTEGLLSPSRTAEVRRHLDDCALCADVRASLDEIRSLLGTLPGPPRMPSAVAGRIDAALAAEALLDATASRAEAPAPEPRAETEAEGEAGAEAETGPRAEAGTDAGGDVSRETAPTPPGRTGALRPSGHPSGPTGPGRRRARRRIAVLAGLTGAAACVLGVYLFGGLTGTGSPDNATHAPASAAARSADTGGYTAQGLRGNVQRLLATANQGQTNKTMGLDTTSPEQAPSDRQAAPATPPVPPCVQRSTGRAEAPLASERGSYEGTPVYLLVLPHPGDPSLADAYLVPAGCGDDPAQAPGKPLLTSTYPRS